MKDTVSFIFFVIWQMIKPTVAKVNPTLSAICAAAAFNLWFGWLSLEMKGYVGAAAFGLLVGLGCANAAVWLYNQASK